MLKIDREIDKIYNILRKMLFENKMIIKMIKKKKNSCPNNSSKWSLVITKILNVTYQKGIMSALIFILFCILVITFNFYVNFCFNSIVILG